MNKEITIIIAGGAGTGKTTMLHFLYSELLKRGFNVGMNSGIHPENIESLIDAVKDDTKITLKEMQTVREIKGNAQQESSFNYD